ncbi:MAG TPA: hypothetical protein DCR14_04820 [Acidimicrobiaceae bacterium]|nr:hypothetical protein [Acidimicrobiaceae bacterium]
MRPCQSPVPTLIYLNNRYHDPALAAFVSVDPLVGKTGEPYLYAGGSPSTKMDPTGLFWECDSRALVCSDLGFTLATSHAASSAGQHSGTQNQSADGLPRRDLDFEADTNAIVYRCINTWHNCAGTNDGGVTGAVAGYLMGLIEAGLLSVYTDPYAGAQSLSLADGVPGNNAFVVTATGNAGDFMLTLNTYHRGYAEAWSELAGPLQVVLTGVAILGYLACPFTGVGCAVGAAASSGAAGLGVVSTVMACGAEVASLDCGVAALGTAIDAATFGAGVFARARWATGATRAGNSAIDYGRALTVPGSSDALALYVEVMTESGGAIMEFGLSAIPTGDGDEIGFTQTTRFIGVGG